MRSLLSAAPFVVFANAADTASYAAGAAAELAPTTPSSSSDTNPHLDSTRRRLLCELKSAIWHSSNPQYLFYTQKAFPLTEQADLNKRPYDLFKLLPVDIPGELVPRKSRTCAVVGSSGILETTGPHGAGIDAHDVVIRLNGAPAGTPHFEQEEQLARIAGTRTDLRVVNGWHVSEAKPFVYGVEPPLVKFPRSEVNGEEVLHWRSRYSVGDVIVGALPMLVYNEGFYGGADFTRFIYWMKYLGIRAKDVRDYDFASALLGWVRSDRGEQEDGSGTVGSKLPRRSVWEMLLDNKSVHTRQHLLVEARKNLERNGRREFRKSSVYRRLQRARELLHKNLESWKEHPGTDKSSPWLQSADKLLLLALAKGTPNEGRDAEPDAAKGVSADHDVSELHHSAAGAAPVEEDDGSSTPDVGEPPEPPLDQDYARDHTAIRPNALPYYLLTPNLLTGLQKFLNDTKPSGPSTGAIGIGLALHLCDTVDLYGFESVDGLQDSNAVKAHYWDQDLDLQRRSEMQQAHPISSEQKRWNELKIPVASGEDGQGDGEAKGVTRLPGLPQVEGSC
eukprot:g4943.t1